MKRFFNKEKMKKWGLWIAKAIAIGLGILGLFIVSVYFGAWGPIPNKTALQELSQQKASEIYDRNGDQSSDKLVTKRADLSALLFGLFASDRRCVFMNMHTGQR